MARSPIQRLWHETCLIFHFPASTRCPCNMFLSIITFYECPINYATFSSPASTILTDKEDQISGKYMYIMK